MSRPFRMLALAATLGFVQFQAAGQVPAGQTPPPNADPYANNPDAGKLQFPLAAPAGKDSGAITKALPGGVNQGMCDPNTWKYGAAFDPPPNSAIWNPVKLKLMRGEKITGGAFFGSTDPITYCAMANAGYDFIWMEMQYTTRDWEVRRVAAAEGAVLCSEVGYSRLRF